VVDAEISIGLMAYEGKGLKQDLTRR